MRLLFVILLFVEFLFSSYSFAQNSYWSFTDEQSIKNKGEQPIRPKKYLIASLNGDDLKNYLFSLPIEFSSVRNSKNEIILPLPDGTFERFKVAEYKMMENDLASSFSQIKTFNVQSIDNPLNFGKLDWTEFGFHAFLRTVKGDVFIDPMFRNNLNDYIVYYTSDFEKDEKYKLPEVGVLKIENNPNQNNYERSQQYCAGGNIHIFRAAIACTGEYAQAATGLTTPTTAQILSAIVTSINRINMIYETEVAISLILVNNQHLLLFSNPATDPFNGNNDPGVLIGESQQVIDNIIGNSSYDIGHTVSTGGGGLAYLGAVCVFSWKAGGVTGLPYPVGDPFDVDYLAHEIGHQFSGNHTFNECGGNENPATQVEPGSGVTIMGYAGLCGINDLASNSIAYFHHITFSEMRAFVSQTGTSNCAQIQITGNNPPQITSVSNNYYIPYSTPFILTGSATDANGDELTYQWEENDIGFGGNWNSGDAPYFRSYAPSISPERIFPSWPQVLSGNYTGVIGEYLPEYDQTLNFVFRVRDNVAGGGGICATDVVVNVANVGPFRITYPSAANITWQSFTNQTIVWNVNGTNNSPVSCSHVNILISYDGGNTFTTLLANTPNDGSQSVMVPSVANTITTCRIKVEANGNIFFDVSKNNFTIIPGTLSISEVAQNNIDFVVYPNPFSKEFYVNAVNLMNEKSFNINVFNSIGECVLSTFKNLDQQASVKVDMDDLSKGIYIVEIKSDDVVKFFKVIKQ
jgi:hypothetical protein